MESWPLMATAVGLQFIGSKLRAVSVNESGVSAAAPSADPVVVDSGQADRNKTRIANN